MKPTDITKSILSAIGIIALVCLLFSATSCTTAYKSVTRADGTQEKELFAKLGGKGSYNSTTGERDTARSALMNLQAQIDAAQANVPPLTQPVWSQPMLTGPNSNDLSNWSHTGGFAQQSSSFEVQRFDGSEWVSVGTGINTGDQCRIRSVSGDQISEWIEFSA